MQFRWVSTATEFQELAEAWDRLLARAAFQSPYLTHAWLSAWWQHLGRGVLRVLVAEERGELLGGVPLSARRWLGFRILEGMGIRHAHVDGTDFLLPRHREAEVLIGLLEQLLAAHREWDLLSLPGVRTSASVLRWWLHLPARFLTRIQWEFQPRWPAPVIPVVDSWDRYLRSQPGRLRRNCRHWERRLEELPGATIHSLAGAEVLAVLPRLAAVEAASWKRIAGYRRFDGPPAAFTNAVLTRMAQAGACQVYLCEAGERPLSYLVALAAGDRMAAFDTAQARGYRRYCLGLNLFRKLVQNTMGNGHRWLDLGSGWEAYKLHWTRFEEACGVLVLSRTHDLRSQLAACTWNGIRRLARARAARGRHAERERETVPVG